MNNSHVQWLLSEELPSLVEKNVLSAETAERIRQYHGEAAGSAPGRRWAVVLFGILGALLVGSGIILLLAHNWDHLSRVTRTGLSFAPLICAQAVAAWVLWRRRGSTAWREGVGTILTLAIGSTISLIAQTYNLAGNFGDFMLMWMLLALPIVYLLNASVPAVIYLAGITVWCGDARFSRCEPLWFWLLLSLVLPYLWRSARTDRKHPRPALIGWALAICTCFGTGFTATEALSAWWIPCYAGLFAALYLMGERWFCEGTHWWQRPLQTIGALGGVTLALILTFRWPWHEAVGRWDGEHPISALVVAGMWPALAVLFWIESITRRRVKEALFGALPLVAAVGYLTASGSTNGEVFATVLFDAFVFILGVGAIWRGVRAQALGTVNGGMLLLATLIVTRFFDSNLTFVVRGLAFILVGTGFFITNGIMIRRKGAVA